MQKITLSDAAETTALGARLAGVLRAGDVVGLRGDLGAGKTTLVRGLIQSALGDIDVPSPTYTLVQSYILPNYELWHCDMYRLERPEEGYELGLPDAFEDAVCMVEWPDKLGNLLPASALGIDIQFADKGRVAVLTGFGDRLD